MSEPHAVADTVTELEMTTNPGLETVAYAEFVDRVSERGIDRTGMQRKASGARGRLLVEAPASFDDLECAARSMRSVHHILRPHDRFEIPDADVLQAIEERVAAIDMPDILPSMSFRVTTRRWGTHDFTSVDVERVAGATVQRKTGARVDLIHHDVNVRVDVIDRICIISTQLTREALSQRHERLYNQRVALRPNVAYAALRLAGIHDGEGARVVLDPCCGTGTMLLEAGDLLPDVELWAGDRNPDAVAGTRRNLEHAGLASRSRVEEVDLREMSRHWPQESVDIIATNPPYGRRLGRGIHFFTFYQSLIGGARRVLRPGGHLAVLARKKDAFLAACRRVGGFTIHQKYVIEAGGLFPAILIARKTGGTE